MKKLGLPLAEVKPPFIPFRVWKWKKISMILENRLMDQDPGWD